MSRNLLRALVSLLVLAAALVVLRALEGEEPTVSGPPTTTASSPGTDEAWNPADADPTTYRDDLALLEQIPQRRRDSGAGYSRERFGERWADVDGNGCDTRNDVLARDLQDVRLRPGTCLVQSGTLHDPFTGAVVEFERGPTTSEAVQIDHLVALYDAWRTGAQGWTAQKRTRLANDPANLLAVDGQSNQDKGHGDAASWLPPNEDFHCDYVAGQVRVKAAYGLWMTPEEHAAARRVLEGCG